jgi:hypothetical protein
VESDLEGYRRFLETRDGTADRLNRSLSARENFFSALAAAPVTSSRRIDPEAFATNLHRRRPEPGLSPELYWLLATAKLNQAERFGVGLSEVYGRVDGRHDRPERLYIELEEHYHSRLLAHVLAMFDLPFEVVVPSTVIRQFVKLNVFLPERTARPIIGASEMAGCVLFELMGEAGTRLFASEPAVADRIRLLYNEILTDEVGHVGFCAALLGPGGRAAMRRFYPYVLRVFCRLTPEVGRVVDPQLLARRLAEPFDPVLAAGGRSFSAAAL